MNAFLTEGDCTPFVPSGKRGTLHNQPPPLAAPVAFFITSARGVEQVPLAMEADLNSGTVTLKGSFPESASTLEYRLEYSGTIHGRDWQEYRLLLESG